MPRKPDSRTEGKILDVAHRLWVRGGEKALTMRAVARAANTTTPTVYQRFRDKTDLLQFVRANALDNLLRFLKPAATAIDTCRRFLAFAQAHPNEYRLLTSDWAVRLASKDRKPAFEKIKGHLAAELGGDPESHVPLALALGEILHGAALMLLADGVHDRVARTLRQVCMAACEALIQHAACEPRKWKSAVSLTAR